MQISSKCALALFLATLGWGQSGVQWPTQTIGAPGTAGLSVVNVSPLPAGYTVEIVASLTERCTPATQTGTATPQRAPLDCTTVTGDPRLMVRQGTRITRAGDTLLPSERMVTQQGTSLGALVEGLELLEEGLVGQAPVFRTLLRVDAPELSCTVSTTGLSVLTHRGIQGFVFNEPLNVLYVETIHAQTTFASASPATPGATGMCGTSATVAEFPVLQESTRTLIRVRGFNNARPTGF